MPDARPAFLSAAAIRADNEAKATSKPYRGHNTVTVYQYLRMSRSEQEAVNRECEQREKGRQA